MILFRLRTGTAADGASVYNNGSNITITTAIRQCRTIAIKSAVGRGSQKGRTLPAVKVDIIDASSAPLTPVNLFVIEAIRLAQGRDMMQIQTKAGKKWGLFDKVNGTDATRKDMLNGRSVKQIVRSWSDGVNAFRQARTPYLIY